MPAIPEFPYIVYGTVTQGGAPQSGVTVTIENLTAGGSDTRITDASGQYLYDDLAQLPNSYSPGDTIQVSVPGKLDSFVAASEPEERPIDLEIIIITEEIKEQVKVKLTPIIEILPTIPYIRCLVREKFGVNGWGKFNL